MNPYKPSKKTNFKGCSVYLLKIHFYETRPKPLNIKEPNNKNIPTI